ncbi:MAG: leucyl aminopeptidase [Sphingopyxis sp.]|nr:leucyl aminopeptidase [Sphingopyxis sp.]
MKIEFGGQAGDQDAFAWPVTSGGIAGVTERLPASLRDVIAGAAEQARFDGTAGTVFETYAAEGPLVRRIVLLGAGAGSDADFERAGAGLSARLIASGVERARVDVAALSADAAARFALGAALRAWRHDQYRTRLPEKQKATLGTVALINAADGAEAAWQAASAILDGVALTRTLVTEPANVIYPQSFVDRCAVIGDAGVTIEVLDETQMAALGMGAILGVGQGSVRPPRILCMEWKGAGAGDAAPIVLIGKGVTFDTGGISIKPAAGMEDMKWDMGGAGAVAGAMLTLARRNAPVHVVGICALAENMPDGNAQRPGDVVTTMSGQTVEVINTDAEGRLVLCDAMTWAQRRFKPDIVVDLATLTGAIMISLGREHAGLFSNDHDLARALVDAGFGVGEKLWRMPLGDAYDRLIDSPIADIKNVGPRDGGSITAAQFLQRFVEPGVKWAHLDIAGMVWSDKDGATYAKGATGYGVRLLDAFVRAHEGR